MLIFSNEMENCMESQLTKIINVFKLRGMAVDIVTEEEGDLTLKSSND